MVGIITFQQFMNTAVPDFITIQLQTEAICYTAILYLQAVYIVFQQNK